MLCALSVCLNVIYILEATYFLTNDGRYGCLKCLSSYKQKSHLKRHLNYECGVERKFTCDNCLQRFKHKSHLQVHQKCCLRTTNNTFWIKLILLTHISFLFIPCVFNLFGFVISFEFVNFRRTSKGIVFKESKN